MKEENWNWDNGMAVASKLQAAYCKQGQEKDDKLNMNHMYQKNIEGGKTDGNNIFIMLPVCLIQMSGLARQGVKPSSRKQSANFSCQRNPDERKP